MVPLSKEALAEIAAQDQFDDSDLIFTTTGIRLQLDRLALHRLPKSWMPIAVRVRHSVAGPLLWLLLLWLASVIAGAADQHFGFVDGVTDLLIAWVVIRLLSFAVRSPVGSAAISIAVWGLADQSKSWRGSVANAGAAAKSIGLALAPSRMRMISPVCRSRLIN